MPRRLAEAIIRWTKGDQLLLNADPTARAAYEARINGVPAGPVAVATEAEKDAA